MTQEFLSFVDEMTDFGKKFITGEELFKAFVAKKQLSDNHAFGFRLRLQKKGIL